jgi:hypothetical protein
MDACDFSAVLTFIYDWHPIHIGAIGGSITGIA